MIGKTINNYVIERKIGTGGMGIVYYARHNRVDREVAIKVLHNNLFTNENIRNRFKNEANALIKLNHPNIVAIFDYVEQENFACLIMEYINGHTIDEYIAKISGPLPSARAVKIITAVLDAVQFAHDCNIYHRDIKPGNIMISQDGSKVKIMDFGIAKLADSSNLQQTHVQAQLGTPFYMSPEQVKGQPLTKLSDIYSLGITLYEMVTGRCPYISITNLFELQSKIVSEALPPTDTYYPDVCQAIQEAVKKATQKLPEQRFQSCTEFKVFLLGWDNKHHTEQRPPTIEVKKIPKQTVVPPQIIEKPKPGRLKETVVKDKKNLIWLYYSLGSIVVVALVIVVVMASQKTNENNNATPKPPIENSDKVQEPDYSLQADTLIDILKIIKNAQLSADNLGNLKKDLIPLLQKQGKNKVDDIDTKGDIEKTFEKYIGTELKPEVPKTDTPTVDTPPTMEKIRQDFFIKRQNSPVCAVILKKIDQIGPFNQTQLPTTAGNKYTVHISFKIDKERCGGDIVYKKIVSASLIIYSIESDNVLEY